MSGLGLPIASRDNPSWSRIWLRGPISKSGDIPRERSKTPDCSPVRQRFFVGNLPSPPNGGLTCVDFWAEGRRSWDHIIRLLLHQGETSPAQVLDMATYLLPQCRVQTGREHGEPEQKKKTRPMEESKRKKGGNTLLKFHVFARDLTTVGGPAATPLILSTV